MQIDRQCQPCSSFALSSYVDLCASDIKYFHLFEVYVFQFSYIVSVWASLKAHYPTVLYVDLSHLLHHMIALESMGVFSLGTEVQSTMQHVFLLTENLTDSHFHLLPGMQTRDL